MGSPIGSCINTQAQNAARSRQCAYYGQGTQMGNLFFHTAACAPRGLKDMIMIGFFRFPSPSSPCKVKPQARPRCSSSNCCTGWCLGTCKCANKGRHSNNWNEARIPKQKQGMSFFVLLFFISFVFPTDLVVKRGLLRIGGFLLGMVMWESHLCGGPQF